MYLLLKLMLTTEYTHTSTYVLESAVITTLSTYFLKFNTIYYIYISY